jgi:hypothetical protein
MTGEVDCIAFAGPFGAEMIAVRRRGMVAAARATRKSRELRACGSRNTTEDLIARSI